MQLIGFFQKMKMDQKILSIDFDSWSELTGSLIAGQKVGSSNPSPDCNYIGIGLTNRKM